MKIKYLIIALTCMSFALSLGANARISTLYYKEGRDYNLIVEEADNETNQEEYLDSFNKAAESNKFEGKIKNCTFLIDIPRGTARGNHSYGGFCELELGDDVSRVIVCTDEMVGHFKVQKLENDYLHNTNLLPNFVIDNCVGG